MAKISKKELIKQVSKLSQTSQVEVSHILESFIKAMGKELASGNDITVSGLGSFKSVIQAGRTGKVPGTNKEYTTEPRRVCKFKSAAPFAAIVEGK